MHYISKKNFVKKIFLMLKYSMYIKKYYKFFIRENTIKIIISWYKNNI